MRSEAPNGRVPNRRAPNRSLAIPGESAKREFGDPREAVPEVI